MNVLIDNSCEVALIDNLYFEALLDYVASSENISKDSEVSLSFVDDDEIKSLNLQYRGIDSPTDVLSFECDGIDDCFPNIENQPIYLGDIVISVPTAQRQASENKHSLGEELEMLIIHGMLHLCGYDHIKDSDAAIMEPLQDKILASWRTLKSQS